ncbi:MAG: hypothetical protein PUF03_01370 [Lachnospiraceae bacterium]|nr:hypothetical protein [Lachnospiraceae bacterium]
MKNKTGIAVIIIILAAILLWGFVSWRQREKKGENEEQSYVQEQKSMSPEDVSLDESISASEKEKNYFIEKSEADEEHKDTEQQSILDEEPEAEELSEEEQIMAWYDEWFNMDNPLWVSNDREFWQKGLTYLLSEPCHFIMFVNRFHGMEDYESRNIDDEMLYDESGSRIYSEVPYIVDVVLDQYIREYGGKEDQYRIKDTSAELGNPWETGLWGVSTYEISNSNNEAKLRVTWDGHNSFVCVFIENDDWEEVTELEKMTYLYYQDMYDHYCYSAKYEEYWLLLNPEFQQKEYCYRNVEQNLEAADDSELKCDERACYIADRAIDKYIRDYGGNDTLYNVELTEKEADTENGGYKYVLFVENLEDSEQIMQIEYSDTDWLVVVKVPDGKERMLKFKLGEEAYQRLYGETE